MQIHHGIDILEKSRIISIYDRFGERFLDKILSSDEKKRFENLKKKKTRMLEFLAGSFSAKESFAKALGSGMRNGLLFNNIQIMRKEFGQPYVKLSDKAKTLLKKKLKNYENYDLSLSISHDRKNVISSVMILFF